MYYKEKITTVGDFFSCRLGLTLRKPLALRDELLASPFLIPSDTLRERQASAHSKLILVRHVEYTKMYKHTVHEATLTHINK